MNVGANITSSTAFEAAFAIRQMIIIIKMANVLCFNNNNSRNVSLVYADYAFACVFVYTGVRAKNIITLADFSEQKSKMLPFNGSRIIK